MTYKDMTETTTTKPTTYDELYKAVEEKRIIAAIRKDGKKDRLFVATNGNLCKFIPKSSRRGFKVYSQDFLEYVKFIEAPAQKTEEDKQAAMEKRIYNDVAKYRRLAMKASFTNNFIEDCKKLPASFEEYKKDRKENGQTKGLYDLGITTGNKIDGVVISLERISKHYRYEIEKLRAAIKNKTEGQICSRLPFAGYEMTISTSINDKGEFCGFMNLEYKDTLNGYYYLLINDDNFIGYDVD